jgi:hypothetical protein
MDGAFFVSQVVVTMDLLFLPPRRPSLPGSCLCSELGQISVQGFLAQHEGEGFQDDRDALYAYDRGFKTGRKSTWMIHSDLYLNYLRSMVSCK